MLTNLLTETLPEGYQKITVGESALYALIGFALVFAGIALLILVVWTIGKAMDRNKTVPVAPPVASQKTEIKPVADSSIEDVDEETVAVIMAALMAYYQSTNPKCEFTVKRIKRI